MIPSCIIRLHYCPNQLKGDSGALTNNKLHWCSTDRSQQGKVACHKILLSKPHQYAGPDTLNFRGHRSILIKPKQRLMKDATHQNLHLHFKWIWDHPLLTKVWRRLWRLIPKTSMTQFATFRHAEDLNGHIDFMISVAIHMPWWQEQRLLTSTTERRVLNRHTHGITIARPVLLSYVHQLQTLRCNYFIPGIKGKAQTMKPMNKYVWCLFNICLTWESYLFNMRTLYLFIMRIKTKLQSLQGRWTSLCYTVDKEGSELKTEPSTPLILRWGYTFTQTICLK